MPHYLLIWDAGYGECSDIEDCEDDNDASMAAYQQWKDHAESQAEYRAVLVSQENVEEIEGQGWDPEDYGLIRSENL